MKFKRIFIVSLLLLTLITIGAVSADENLTADDFSEDSILESSLDNIDLSAGDEDVIAGSQEISDEDITVKAPKTVKACDDSEIKVTLPKDASGYITKYMDDEDYGEYYVYEGVSHVYFTFDSLGSHSIDLVYSGDDTYDEKLIWSKTYNIKDFVMPVSCDYSTYGESSTISVNLPYDAEGNLTLSINGRTYTKKVSGWNYFEVSDLKFGENPFTVTYSGDDVYHSISVDDVITTHPNIVFPDTLNYNQEATVRLNLPANAKGSLIVKFNGKKYSSKLVKGKAAIAIPTNLNLGDYDFEAYYNGTDYEVNEVFTEISVCPSVNIPKYMWVEDNNNLVFEVPKNYGGKLTVTLDGDEYKSVNVKNGKATISLSDLSENYYSIYLEYSADNGYSYVFDCEFEIRENSPNFNLDVDIFKEAFWGETLDFISNMPDDYDGDIEVFVDGVYNERVNIDTSELNKGKHTVKFIFENDSYYNAFNKSFSFNVVDVKIDIPNQLIIGGYDDEINVEVTKNATGNITVYVDGKKFKMMPILPVFHDDEYGYYYSFDVNELSLGKHSIKVAYSGDKNHKAVTKSADVNVSYTISLDSWGSDGDGTFYYDGENVVLVYLPADTTKNISVKIDGKAFKKFTVEDYYYRIFYLNISDLNIGNHTIQVSYPGDEKYTQLKVSDKFSIIPNIVIDDNEVYLGQNSYVSLELPKDANGKLVVTLDNGKKYTKSLNNGFANISISNLAAGEYDVYAYYTGSDYEVEDKTAYLNVYRYNFDYEQYSLSESGFAYLKLPKDAKGNLIVKMDGKQYKKLKLTNGEANVTIKPQFGNHHFEFLYDGDDYEFSSDDDWSLDQVYVIMEPIYIGNPMVLELPKDAKGILTVTINGKAYSPKIVKGYANFTPTNLHAGTNDVSIKYIDNDYGNYEENYPMRIVPTVNVGHNDDYTKMSWDVYGGFPSLDRNVSSSDYLIFDLGKKFNGEYAIIINDNLYTKGKLADGAANISLSKVKVGFNRINIVYQYAKKEYDYTYFYTNIKKAPNLSVTTENVYDGQKVNIGVTASKEVNGKAILTINNKNYTLNLVKGKASKSISNLAIGKYPISVRYIDDKDFATDFAKATVEVLPKVSPKLAVSVLDGIVGQNTVINVSANNEINGNVIVNVNKVNHEVKLVDGQGSLSLSNLKYGSYAVKVSFAGNAKFLPQNATKTFKVTYVPKITAKSTSVLYTAKGKYSVIVYGTDGKAAKNVYVVFKIGKKQVAKVKTNSRGVATYTVTKTPGSYKISATALGKTVTKKLTVKHVVTLKTVKVKKSAKQLVLTATLKKVNGKYLKKKSVTFKFNGKKYTAKTNKKGVAKVTIKKTVLKKLKVGKKVAYQATYLKDTVKKSVKVKK